MGINNNIIVINSNKNSTILSSSIESESSSDDDFGVSANLLRPSSSRSSHQEQRIDFETCIRRVGLQEGEKIQLDKTIFPLVVTVRSLGLGVTFPEAMLSNCTQNHKKNKRRDFYKNYRALESVKLKEDSRIFSKINAAIKALEKLNEEKKHPHILKLAKVYEKFRADIIRLSGKDRRRRIKGPVRVVTILNHEMICLLLSQKQGRSIVSISPYNETVRQSDIGASAVYYDRVNNLFLKRQDNNPLRPGLEQMNHQFSALLSGSTSSPPTHILRLFGLFLRDAGNELEVEHPLRKAIAEERFFGGKKYQEIFGGKGEIALTERVAKVLNCKRVDAGALRKQIPFAEIHKGETIQVSEGVPGKPLDKALLKDANLSGAKVESFSRGFLVDSLLLPSDGRGDNFRFRGDGSIVEIDYDRPIHPAFELRGRGEEIYLSCKTIRFLIDSLMKKSISAHYVSRLKEISPTEIIVKWIARLYSYNQEIDALYKKGLLNSNNLKEMDLPLQIGSFVLPHICDTLTKIKNEVERSPKITHWDLLEKIDPLLCAFYSQAVEEAEGAMNAQRKFLFPPFPPNWPTMLGNPNEIVVEKFLDQEVLNRPDIKKRIQEIKEEAKREKKSLTPKEALVSWLTSHLKGVNPQEQESALTLLLDHFSHFDQLTLNGISFLDGSFSNKFKGFKGRVASKITIANCKGVLRENLKSIRSQNLKIVLVVGENEGVSGRDLLELIKLSETLQRPLAFFVAGQEIPFAPDSEYEILKESLLSGEESIAEAMLLRGALSKKSADSLIHIVAEKGPAASIRFLLKEGAKVDATYQGRASSKERPIHMACKGGKIENVMELVGNKANLSARDLNGGSPLYYAIQNRHTDLVKKLIGLNVIDLKQKLGPQKETPLHIAARTNNLDLVDYFLKIELGKGWVHEEDDDGRAPLHALTKAVDSPTIANRLIQAGANVNQRNKYGYTPMHWAAMERRRDSFKVLFDKGGRIDLANFNNDTPFDLAIRWGGDDEIAYYIISKAESSGSKKSELSPFESMIMPSSNRQEQIRSVKKGEVHSSSTSSSSSHHATSSQKTGRIIVQNNNIQLLSPSSSSSSHHATSSQQTGQAKGVIGNNIIIQNNNIQLLNSSSSSSSHHAISSQQTDRAKGVIGNNIIIQNNNIQLLSPSPSQVSPQIEKINQESISSSKESSLLTLPNKDRQTAQEWINCFRQIRKSWPNDTVAQMFALYKASNLLLAESKYRESALVLNSAVPLVQSEESLRLLETQRERIEGFYCMEVARSQKLETGWRGANCQARRQLDRWRKGGGSNDHPSRILGKICGDSVKMLGKKMPRFTWIGFGEIAQGGLLPYSSFSACFLIEKEADRKGIEHLKDLIELKIINLGETPYPILENKDSLVKSCFYSFVPDGFDLHIVTPTALASVQQQNSQKSLSLCSALKTTSPLYGDIALHKAYKEELGKRMKYKPDGSFFNLIGTKYSEVQGREQLNEFIKYNLKSRDCRGSFVMAINGLTDFFCLDRQKIDQQISSLVHKGKIDRSSGTLLLQRWNSLYKTLSSQQKQDEEVIKQVCSTLGYLQSAVNKLLRGQGGKITGLK